VCACVRARVCVCVCVCACVRTYMYVRVCVTSLEVCGWLLVETSSGPGAGGGGEQREEERGTSIWRDFHSVSLVLACCHARCKHSSPALAS